MGWYERLDYMCSIVKNVKSLELCFLVSLCYDLMKLMMNLLRLRDEVVRPPFHSGRIELTPSEHSS